MGFLEKSVPSTALQIWNFTSLFTELRLYKQETFVLICNWLGPPFSIAYSLSRHPIKQDDEFQD